MKNINYYRPDLTKFFTDKEIESCMPNNNPETII